jgi:general secretion pathway protein B
MSYILDALKKSEQQRQRGAAPSLLATQVTTAAPRHQPAVLFYGLAAALLVAGIAIGMLRPWRAEAPALPSVATKPPEPVVPPSPPAPAHASVDITIRAERPTPVPAPVTQAAPSPAGGALKAQLPAPATPTPSVPSATASTPESKVLPPASEKPVAGRPQDAAPERRLMTLAELPVSIQQEIPKLSIMFHIYSGNPKDRLVGINDRILHEGDSVEPGLVLEQITPDGMILTYKEYRFLRGPR